MDLPFGHACFPFLKGLQSAALSLAFLPDGSLIVGESNRGWNSQGTRSFGLERIRWTGRIPFETKSMEALRDGFRLRFTMPVQAKTAAKVGAYAMTSYTYLYHQKYGSEEVQTQPVKIAAAEVEEGGTCVRLKCEGLREGFVHELHLTGITSKDGQELWHDEAYYTLNHLPK